jgi:protein KRI1
MPTRFNYVPVGKQNYSLDPVEILMADDKDLNEYMSIKKYAPYRQEKGDRSKWDKRQQDKLKDLKETLKKKQRAFGHYDPSAGVVEGGDRAQEKPKKKRMGKKERMKAKVADGEDGEGGEDGEAMEVDVPAPAELSSKKKRKREGPDEDDKEAAPAPESGAGADEGAKRKKRRRRPKKTEGAAQGQS